MEMVKFIIGTWIFSVVFTFMVGRIPSISDFIFRINEKIFKAAGVYISSYSGYITLAFGMLFIAVAAYGMIHWIYSFTSDSGLGVQAFYYILGFVFFTKPIHRKLKEELKRDESSTKVPWLHNCFHTANIAYLMCLFFPDLMGNPLDLV